MRLLWVHLKLMVVSLLWLALAALLVEPRITNEGSEPGAAEKKATSAKTTMEAAFPQALVNESGAMMILFAQAITNAAGKFPTVTVQDKSWKQLGSHGEDTEEGGQQTLWVFYSIWPITEPSKIVLEANEACQWITMTMWIPAHTFDADTPFATGSATTWVSNVTSLALSGTVTKPGSVALILGGMKSAATTTPSGWRSTNSSTKVFIYSRDSYEVLTSSGIGTVSATVVHKTSIAVGTMIIINGPPQRQPIMQ